MKKNLIVSKKPAIVIIIVNWNSTKLSIEAARTVLEFNPSIAAKIIIVDNCSQYDSALQQLDIEPFDCSLIRNDRNVGFSAANNIGIKVADSEYYLLLNPDTIQTEDAIARSLKYMDRNQDVGVLGIQHIQASTGSIQPSAFFFHSVWYHNLQLVGLSWLCTQPKPVDHHREQDVGWVAGSFFLLRKKCLIEVGLLDEQFFLNNEDVDWCHRATNAGWKIRYWPGAKFVHIGGGTRHMMLNQSFVYLRSNLIFCAKHSGLFATLFYYLVVSAFLAAGLFKVFFLYILRINKSFKCLSKKAKSAFYFVFLYPPKVGC